ncbi:hypothetical protein [Mycolicibacterium phlei]|uniref:hypothetical protein n=1 Tax=Mycolicibacterium phlei TaxID=1771 RepID=UPI001038E22C|nr:hypothetical protein [Mycolicibacterium phlei]
MAEHPAAPLLARDLGRLQHTWLPVWLLITLAGGEKRRTLPVDALLPDWVHDGDYEPDSWPARHSRRTVKRDWPPAVCGNCGRESRGEVFGG